MSKRLNGNCIQYISWQKVDWFRRRLGQAKSTESIPWDLPPFNPLVCSGRWTSSWCSLHVYFHRTHGIRGCRHVCHSRRIDISFPRRSQDQGNVLRLRVFIIGHRFSWSPPNSSQSCHSGTIGSPHQLSLHSWIRTILPCPGRGGTTPQKGQIPGFSRESICPRNETESICPITGELSKFEHWLHGCAIRCDKGVYWCVWLPSRRILIIGTSADSFLQRSSIAWLTELMVCQS